MDNVVVILVLSAAVGVPFILEFMAFKVAGTYSNGHLSNLAGRALRVGFVLAVTFFCVGMISSGTVSNLNMTLQLLLLSAVLWVPSTVAAYVVGRVELRRRNREDSV